MDSNKTVTATFTQNQYKLTILTNFGTTTPAVGEYWYPSGSNVTIEASSPSAGTDELIAGLVGWGQATGSYTGTENPVVITMDGPVTETATWKHQYKLTLSSNSGATTPSIGQHWYDAGTQVTIERFASYW